MFLLLTGLSASSQLSVSPREAAGAIPSVATLNVVPYPISLGYNPSNAYVYVGGFDGSISVISGTKVVGGIPSNQAGYSALSFAYNPHNQAVYVAGGNGVWTISGINTT